MKITYRWLQDFVAVDVSPQALARQLTEAGLEVESIVPVAPAFAGVVVGKVLACNRHPDAEKLSVCEVTTDGKNRLQIICGAPNVRAGLFVAVAMVGARLPNDVTIKQAKLRGLESQGMLCSARELGLGTEHDGILELDAALALNGDVRDALDLDDSVLEVNATPNRGDCMSVFGIARDYAAASKRQLLTYAPGSVAAASTEVVAARSEAGEACPRFATRVIRGIKPAMQSPPWLRERLRRIGMGSISLIVDATNYVMSELGHPLHAFDLAKLSADLHVRWARPSERVTLLDGKEVTLDDKILVIADKSGALSLAGIMGGSSTSISDATTDVLLEAAHWQPQIIAAGSRRLGIFTDAAQRFERGVDPQLPVAALERATALILECGGGTAGPIRVEEFSALRPVPAVLLRRERLARVLGASVPDEDVRAVMCAISGTVDTVPGGWRVAAPSHRFDIRIEADLIEEVARIRGFDSIPEMHAMAPQVAGFSIESKVSNERVLHAIVDRGYREAITYAFVDPTLQSQLFPDVPALALLNPISAELGVMRVSLWPGLIQACRENLHRQQSRVRLFEVGRKYLVNDGGLAEIDTLAAIATGTRVPEQWGSARDAADFFDIKSDVDALLALTGDGAAHRYEEVQLSCLRPGRAAKIFRGNTAIGLIGEMHPQLVRALGLNITPLLFDLEMDPGFAVKVLKYQHISKFPSVRRDLAIVVDEGVSLAKLRENVTVSASGLLTELRIFDVYRGPGIDSGRKSVALGLILQDSSRTLTDMDADAVVTAVMARLRDVLSATIRD